LPQIHGFLFQPFLFENSLILDRFFTSMGDLFVHMALIPLLPNVISN